MVLTGHPLRRWDTWIILLLGLYFAGRLLYFAFTVGPNVPPDEITHVGIVKLYAEAPLMPENSPASYSLGLVTHAPYLYYLIMGKAAALFGSQGLELLRLLNVGMALVLLFFAYRLSALITANPLVRILFFTLLTNTLMFTFLSASVNYDNLTNLLAVISLYYLVRHIQSGERTHLLIFLTATGLGLLTKASFLMLAPIYWALWLFMRRRELAADWRRLASDIRTGNRPVLALLGVLLLCLTANLSLYGVNLVRYGSVIAPCDRVLTLEQCMENRIFARNKIVERYRTDQISLMEAWQATEQIKNRGDSNHAKRLLQNEREYKATKPENLNIVDYMKLVWDQAIKTSVFGIQAHQSMLRHPNQLWPYALVLFAALLLWVRNVRSDGSDKIWLGFAVIVFTYYGFLVGYYNYDIYLRTHALLMGVQGRYLFIVIVPAYLLVAEFLLRPFRRGVQLLVVLGVGGLFIAGDLPFYLEHVTEAWKG